MASGRPTTRADFVHAQIRDEILQGVLPPGHRLRLAELAERFSVSQSVIREALTRLAERGLAVALPQQGFRVITLSPEDLNELTEARVQVEGLVLRHAVQRGDIGWESSVVAAHHHLANTPETRPDGDLNGNWFAVHEHFHRTLLGGCGNGRLAAVAISLRDAAALYRRWSLPVGHDYERDVAGEHQALLDAVLARDPSAAAKVLRRHIERTSDAMRAIADGQDDGPVPQAAPRGKPAPVIEAALPRGRARPPRPGQRDASRTRS